MLGSPSSSLNLKAMIRGKIFFVFDIPDLLSFSLSRRLFYIFSRYGIYVDIVDLKDYNCDNLLHESLAVFFASAGNDGRPSADLDALVRWLFSKSNSSGSSTLLKRCKFVVVGVESQRLGTHWKRVTALGTQLVEGMRSLGASQILPVWVGNVDSAEFKDKFDFWSWKLVGRLIDCIKDETNGSKLDNNFREAYTDHDVVDGFLGYDSGEELRELDFAELDDEESLESEEVGILNQDGEVHNKKPRITWQDTVFYVLLEYKVHRSNTDQMVDESEDASVASLYRVEIEDKADVNTIRPLGSPVLNFPSDNYPVGMGCGALGSKIIFVGGHFHRPESTTDNPSNKIYILDTSIDHLTECGHNEGLEIKESPKLNKSNPVVVNVRGKLFVLPNNFSGWNDMDPTIESYDPQKDNWKSFNIFDIYKGCGSLKRRPQHNPAYKVQAYCVKDSMIFIRLCHETYAFNVNKGKLYLVVPSGFEQHATPFDGMGVYAGGCFFGLKQKESVLYAHKHNPFKEKFFCNTYSMVQPDFHYLPDLVSMQGVICHLRNEGETNRLLVVRSGIVAEGDTVIDDRLPQGLYLVFDMLNILKGAQSAMQFKTDYHIVMHVSSALSGHIKACLPITKSQHTISLMRRHPVLRIHPVLPIRELVGRRLLGERSV